MILNVIARGGDAMVERARKAMNDAKAKTYALADVKLEAPIRRPPKVLAVGIVDQNRQAFGFDDVVSDRPAEWELVAAPASTSFESLAARADLTEDELAQWNPIYVRRRTPPDRPSVRLRVPAGRGEKTSIGSFGPPGPPSTRFATS